MIGVNPLRTKVLITTDEVIFHSATDHELDPRILLPNIIIAERRLITPITGYAIYKALIDSKNKIVTPENLATLESEINTGRPADRAEIKLVVGDYVNSDEYLSSAQKELWSDHLHKIVAECVWFVSLPVNRVRFTAAGMMKNNPETIAENRSSVTADLPDLKHLLDKGLNERIGPLLESLHEYLCLVSYPGYKKDCGCGEHGSGTQKSSGVLFGLYDDDKPKRRGW